MRNRVSNLIPLFLLIHVALAACNEARFSGGGRSRGAATDPSHGQPHNPDGTPTNNDPSNNPGGGNTPSGQTNTPVDVTLVPPGSNNPGNGTNPNMPKPGIGGGVTNKQFDVRCSQGQDSAIAALELAAPRTQRVEAQIQGEFCPNSTNKLSVLFLVDFSASMGKHKFSGDGKIYDGNDPLNEQTGSCGRLSAAKAVIAKLESMATAGDDIQVSIIPFAGSVVNERIVSFRSLSAFKNALNKDNLCRYVAQGSAYYTPGYINPSSVGASSSTNYGAAFLAAENALIGRNGQKVVYFISDGEPTSPSNDPVGAGIRAGKNLRDRTTNLTVNGLLLKTRTASAVDVLNQVTGSPARVKHADQASQLADKILEFGAAAIDERFGSAKIYAHPYPEQFLGLISMKKTSGQVWTYLTQPFVLVGIPGKAVENRVTVYAKGTDGSVHSSIVTIRYTQQ